MSKCPICNDNGLVNYAPSPKYDVRSGPCYCLKGRSYWSRRLGVPERFHLARLEDFPAYQVEDDDDDIENIWWWSGEPYGWFIWGSPGTGKTHLASALVEPLLQISQYVPQFVTAAALLEATKRSWDRDQDSLKLLENLEHADVVILDDLGAERTTDWSETELTRWIDDIYGHMGRLVVTSNLSPELLGRRYGQRLAGRIMELCRPWHMGGVDRRLEIARQRQSAESKPAELAGVERPA